MSACRHAWCSDACELRGLWATDKALTALETAGVVTDGSVFLDRALQRHVSFTRVHRAYCRNLGARGSARAGDLLVAAADRADSAAERRAVAILRAAGIAGWVLGHPFGKYLIDIAFPGARLAVEIDGWRGTWGSTGFVPTGTRATPWCAHGGTCCGSPGTT